LFREIAQKFPRLRLLDQQEVEHTLVVDATSITSMTRNENLFDNESNRALAEAFIKK
jgi:hypothetical protein